MKGSLVSSQDGARGGYGRPHRFGGCEHLCNGGRGLSQSLPGWVVGVTMTVVPTGCMAAVLRIGHSHPLPSEEDSDLARLRGITGGPGQ